MNADDVLIQVLPGHHRVILNRPDRKNSLTPEWIERILAALAACEQDPNAKALVLEGSGGVFSNGMDLAAAGAEDSVGGNGGERFALLLSRITKARVVVIAKVEGHARGGGLGLMAACDFVFADDRGEFSLPELLWGLVPCIIAPFLVRRIGHRACRCLTLSTLPMNAKQALECGLVDSLEPEALTRCLRRLGAVPREGIGAAKAYLQGLSPIEDAVLERAVAELQRLMFSPEVSGRLQEFARSNRFPWEKAR